MTPQTLPEWEAYVDEVPIERLTRELSLVNTQRFADKLMDEGLPLKDVETIVLFFVRRMVREGLKLPEGGAFALYEMSKDDPMSAAHFL